MCLLKGTGLVQQSYQVSLNSYHSQYVCEPKSWVRCFSQEIMAKVGRQHITGHCCDLDCELLHKNKQTPVQTKGISKDEVRNVGKRLLLPGVYHGGLPTCLFSLLFPSLRWNSHKYIYLRRDSHSFYASNKFIKGFLVFLKE